MSRPVLNATPRSGLGKSANRKLRQIGRVPAVVYGKGLDPVSVSLDPKATTRILKSPLGRNTPLHLQIEGESDPRLTLMKDFQVDPVSRSLVHVDLLEVSADTPINVAVPFMHVGKSEAEKAGARVRRVRKHVLVRCLPDDIPPVIEFDITPLPEDQRKVMMSEVPMPEGIEAVFRNDFNLLQFKSARAIEEEMEALEGLAEPEEGEELEEGEEGEEAEASAEAAE